MNVALQHPLSEVVAEADCLHDRVALEAAIVRMGREITAALAGERAVFLTVMNGGMFFASPLSFAIGSDLEFDYAHATRYRDGTVGLNLEWRRKPHATLQGRTVLLVDDILDEGYTLAGLRDYCVEQRAKRVLIAVLCLKRHDRRIRGLDADFVGVEIPDRYVFGYGLDYYGQGRNLPAIYAVKGM